MRRREWWRYSSGGGWESRRGRRRRGKIYDEGLSGKWMIEERQLRNDGMKE